MAQNAYVNQPMFRIRHSNQATLKPDSRHATTKNTAPNPETNLSNLPNIFLLAGSNRLMQDLISTQASRTHKAEWHREDKGRAVWRSQWPH